MIVHLSTFNRFDCRIGVPDAAAPPMSLGQIGKLPTTEAASLRTGRHVRPRVFGGIRAGGEFDPGIRAVEF
jgi:hypothetical protein